MKMNRELLRTVATKLRRLRHEKHYDQGEIITKNSCGTTACIGGWAAMLADGVEVKPNPESHKDLNLFYKGRLVVGSRLDFAKRRLGLGQRMANWLFSGGPITAWPEEYGQRLNDGERPSRVAADLLDAIADGKITAKNGKPDWL